MKVMWHMIFQLILLLHFKRMKKITIVLSTLSVLIMSSGCSGTWDGVKNDTGKAWDSTKETIHEATK